MVISLFYIAFRDNPIIRALLLGMQAGVAAVIVDVIINMASKVIKNKRILPIAVMVLAFIAATFFNINIVIILLICGALGAYTTFRTNRLSKKKAKENIASDDLQERKKEIRK
jgi:chromate transporter